MKKLHLRPERKIHWPDRRRQPVANMIQPPGSVASATMNQIRESAVVTKMKAALKKRAGR